MVLRREVAQWYQLASGVLVFLVPVLGLSTGQSGAITAVLTAGFALATAGALAGEKAAAAVSGLIKALIALALAFRFKVEPDVLAGAMVGVEAVVAFWLRTQVTAKKPDVMHAGKLL